jgi:hypothetical protein
MAGCKSAAAHRKAQNKYVAKSPSAQRDRVKRSEAKNKSKIAARKKRTPKSKGGPKGRPRKC